MKENPDLFNRKVVVERFLKQIKVPGINEIMKDVPSPEKRDSAGPSRPICRCTRRAIGLSTSY